MAQRAYAITFDLRDKSHNYTYLFNVVKSIGEWKHPHEPLWVVVVDDNNYNANEIFNKLKLYIQQADLVFIVDITHSDRQGWMPSTTWDMLKNYGL